MKRVCISKSLILEVCGMAIVYLLTLLGICLFNVKEIDGVVLNHVYTTTWLLQVYYVMCLFIIIKNTLPFRLLLYRCSGKKELLRISLNFYGKVFLVFSSIVSVGSYLVSILVYRQNLLNMLINQWVYLFLISMYIAFVFCLLFKYQDIILTVFIVVFSCSAFITRFQISGELTPLFHLINIFGYPLVQSEVYNLLFMTAFRIVGIGIWSCIFLLIDEFISRKDVL